MDGFISWHRERPDIAESQREVESWAAAGAYMSHPGANRAIALNVDGGQVEVLVPLLKTVTCSGLAAITFQFWFTADEDLVVRSVPLPGGLEARTYYLDGLDERQVSLVEHQLMELVESSPDRTICIVIDRRGRSVDVDWDSIILYSGPFHGPLPDAVIARKSILEKLPPSSQGIDSVAKDLCRWAR